MGWLRLVGSLKIQVSFAEYGLFYRTLLQKIPMILKSLLVVATPYHTVWRTLRCAYCTTTKHAAIQCDSHPVAYVTWLITQYDAYCSASTATHRNTLQHIATHCNTRSNGIFDMSYHIVWCTLQCACCNTLQHTATHCNTRTVGIFDIPHLIWGCYDS